MFLCGRLALHAVQPLSSKKNLFWYGIGYEFNFVGPGGGAPTAAALAKAVRPPRGLSGDTSKDYEKPRQTIQSPRKIIQRHKILDRTQNIRQSPGV